MECKEFFEVTDNQLAAVRKTGRTTNHTDATRTGTAQGVAPRSAWRRRPARHPVAAPIFLVVFVLFLFVLNGCTQGVTGIFADIEQEVEIKTNNLVDNTFVARVVQADTDGTDRFYAVAGTKLFARNVDGSSWSGTGSPPGRSLAQFVAAIDGTELYAVFREAEKDNYGLYRLNANGSWELQYDPRNQEAGEPPVNRITGLTGIDTTGGTSPDQLIATMADENGKRYLVVDPQLPGRTFHEFENADGGAANGDDLDANRPAGKALVSSNGVTGDILWVARNALWYIDITDLGTDTNALTRVPTPTNLASIEYVPGEDRLFLVTLDGGVFRSPETIEAATDGGAGIALQDWTATGAEGWESVASQSRAFSDLLWISTGAADHDGLFLVSTLTYGNRTRRGYFHARPSGDAGDEFSSLGFSDPEGNYRSTELSTAGISRITRLGNTVFALTENNGLWSTPSYSADQVDDPVWLWE